MKKLPFKLNYKLPFKPLRVERQEQLDEEAQNKAKADFEPIQAAWLDAIKKIARDNIQSGFEYQRIEWVNRFKKPKYESFDEYTREESTLESWEQYLFENPRDLENQGITQRKNTKTGYKYYQTGDPLIDRLEKEFAAGTIPDLDKEFGHIKQAPDFFRTHYGSKISPDIAYKQVKKDASGEKISEAGTRVEVDNYKNSDDWLNEALNDDPVLKKMAEKLGRPK